MLPALLAGSIAMLVFSWVPLFGPLLAGFIAGLAAQRGPRAGATAGALSGLVAGLLLGGLLLLLARVAAEVVTMPWERECWDFPGRVAVHISGALVLLLHVLYFALLGSLGGVLGGTLVRPRRIPAGPEQV